MGMSGKSRTFPESESNEELMEQKGKYYELFLVQSKYYGEGGAADVD